LLDEYSLLNLSMKVFRSELLVSGNCTEIRGEGKESVLRTAICALYKLKPRTGSGLKN